jgi:hypothetical protein
MKKNRKIPAIILLLVSFWFSDLLAAKFFPDDLNIPVGMKQWFVKSISEFLKSMKEQPLWSEAKDRNRISYRFILKQGWAYKDVVMFRIDQGTKNNWSLTVKQTDHFPSKGDFKATRKRLSIKEVKGFQELFAQLQFWELPSVGAPQHEVLMFKDYPPIWILEAVHDRRYQVIRRIAPKNTSAWGSDPQMLKIFKDQGYPDIDRATSEEINRKLVAVGEYLVKLSGLKLELH